MAPRLLAQKLFYLYTAGAFTPETQKELDKVLPAVARRHRLSLVQSVITEMLDAGKVVTELFDRDWFLGQASAGLRCKSHPLFDHLALPEAGHLSPHGQVQADWYLDFHCLERGRSILEDIAGQGPRAKVNPFFDPDFYGSRTQPRERFLFLDYHKRGWRLGLDPSPLFSTSEYLTMNKDVADWGVDPLFHFVQWGLRERRQPRLRSTVLATDWSAGPLPSNRHITYTPLSGPFAQFAIKTPKPISKALRAAIKSCAGLDPRLDKATANPALPIRALPDIIPRFSFARSILLDPLATSNVWILSSWLVRGGAERVIANIANSYSEQFGAGRVTVIVTDFDRFEILDWFSPGVNVVMLSDLYSYAGREEILLMLRQAIIFARPKAVLNVNSSTGWELIEQYGRPLSQLTRFMAAFFCNDYDSNGIPVGYCADYFDSTFGHISRYVTDHATFLRDLFEKKNLSPLFDERVEVLYQPAGPAKPRATARTRARSSKVLWVGRHSAQKRPELAAQIATLAPEWQFDFFGTEFPSDFPLPANATVKGAVASFSDIPVEEYKCLLHTAAWDGLPNVLLEASHCGLPIVAPAVGGISELVNEKTGWLVRDQDDPRAYHQALEALGRNNAEASRRIATMRALLSRRHSSRAFDSRIRTIFGD